MKIKKTDMPKSNKIKRQEKERKEQFRKERELKQSRSLSAKKKKEEERVAYAVSLLSSSRAGTRNPKEAIKAIYKGEKINAPISSPLRAYQTMFENMAHRGHYEKEALYHLLLHMEDQGVTFVDRTDWRANQPGARSFANAISALCILHNHWLRKLTDWKSPSHNTRKQFSSLVRHLLAKYHVPLFMDDAFFSANPTHQSWFIHIGRGENIRTASNLPIPFTKKIAHQMMTAPNEFDVNAAIRWGQIKAMGGDERMIRAILKTRMGISFVNNEFWESVFRWFMENPMLDTAQYAPLIDYINHQKFVPSVPNNDALGPALVPAQPHMSMNKRSVDATLKAMETWHKQTGRANKSGVKTWGYSGIPGFSQEEGEHKKKLYTVTELLSAAELREEGNYMCHCVGSYAYSCANGRTSVWSIKEYSKEGVERLLTVEVDNQSRSIRQARGKYNGHPSAKARDIMNRWAVSAGLSISRWLI